MPGTTGVKQDTLSSLNRPWTVLFEPTRFPTRSRRQYRYPSKMPACMVNRASNLVGFRFSASEWRLNPSPRTRKPWLSAAKRHSNRPVIDIALRWQYASQKSHSVMQVPSIYPGYTLSRKHETFQIDGDCG